METLTRLSLQQKLGLIGGNMAHSRKDIGTVSGCPFDTVPMVNLSFSGLCVNVKELEIVVKVDFSGAQVPAKERGMSRENSGDIDPSPFDKNKGHSS